MSSTASEYRQQERDAAEVVVVAVEDGTPVVIRESMTQADWLAVVRGERRVSEWERAL